jgi:hypothetical protein
MTASGHGEGTTGQRFALRVIKRAWPSLLYLAWALSASGCVPIGVRVQNMLA